jgi:putative ABC transport system substrate-binding protein
MTACIRRREFITLLGAVAAPVVWPLRLNAQQRAMPVIGFLNTQSPDGFTDRLRGFRQGLKEVGYVEGETVAIEYRWAENQLIRLPELAADLVRRQVAVIVSGGGHTPALAAKAATTTIPIVFVVAEDPVRLGLVASLARPGGNLTGINFFSGELGAKQFGLLRELVPGAVRMGVLVNPANPRPAEMLVPEVEAAARTMGLQIQIFNASTGREINTAFAAIARERSDAILIVGDPYFTVRRVQLANLAARHAIPASYVARDFPEAGGLMSYGTDITDTYRQVGVYAGRILKGAKPADLPVVQASKFELVINLATAMMLGLDVPPTLLARADEVIE